MDENLKISYVDETLTAALSGEIDHHRAVSVRAGIDEAMYRELPKTLVIDIGGVDFMDSSGLGLILGRYTKAKEIGTMLVIRNPSARAEKMLKMAGIDRMIKIENQSDRGKGV